jgi:type VII secretion integral membrane protein EccD
VSTTTGISGLVRVTVTAGERRTDLALPATVSVADLLPELARSLGILDPLTVHAGFHLHTVDGQQLSGSTGLAFQNVRDGAVLTLTSGIDDEPPRVYDDVVEAMADVVERELQPWEPSAARRTALAAAAALLCLGALATGLQRPSVVAGALAGVVAIVLTAAAVVLARVEKEHEVAVLLAWAGVAYGAVCGLTVVEGSELLAEPLAAAGGVALALGLVSFAGLVEHRSLMLPAVIVGAVAAASSGIISGTDFRPAAVYTVALTVAVLIVGILPIIALAASGNRSPEPQNPADLPAEPAPVEERHVRDGASLGHDVLLASTITIGLLAILIAPLAVTLGVTGALTAMFACLILLLRTRQHRAGSEVFAGLGTGLVGLMSVAISILVLQPDWRPSLAVILAATAAVTLVVTLVPSTPSVARGRTAEIVEVVALVAMLPLVITAIGLVSTVRS